jgi:hypothetical protein
MSSAGYALHPLLGPLASALSEAQPTKDHARTQTTTCLSLDEYQDHNFERQGAIQQRRQECEYLSIERREEA